jgi:hypothetical protein
MLKNPCPYHKTPVNHTLEQCDMLKKFYGRAATKDAEAKKDGGDGDAGGFPAVENVFLIFEGRPSACRAASASGSGTRSSPRRRHLPPSSTGRRMPSPSAVKITRTASLTRASTHWWSTRSLGTRGSQRSRWTEAAASTSSTRTRCACWGSGWTSCGPARRRFMASRRASASSPRADRSAGLVRHSEQFPHGDAHLRGGGVPGRLSHHT